MSFVIFLYPNEAMLPNIVQDLNYSRNSSITEAGFNAGLGGKHLSFLSPVSSTLPSNGITATPQDALGVVRRGNALGRPGMWIFGVDDARYLRSPGILL